MITMRWRVSDTQRAMALSSSAIGSTSFRYSSLLETGSLPLIRTPVRLLWHGRRGIGTAVLNRLGEVPPMPFMPAWVLTGAYQLIRPAGFFGAPNVSGAHAVALTPERKLILVKLRYAYGWRPPGGGRSAGESPEQGGAPRAQGKRSA